jgi:hypothetical protein
MCQENETFISQRCFSCEDAQCTAAKTTKVMIITLRKLTRKPEKEGPLGRLRGRWEDNTTKYLI